MISMDPTENGSTQLTPTQMAGENDVAGNRDGDYSPKKRSSSKVLKTFGELCHGSDFLFIKVVV